MHGISSSVHVLELHSRGSENKESGRYRGERPLILCSEAESRNSGGRHVFDNSNFSHEQINKSLTQ